MGANLEVEMLDLRIGLRDASRESFEDIRVFRIYAGEVQSGLKENVKVGFTTSEHKPIRKTLVL